MKRLFVAAILLLGLSMFFPSCSSNDNTIDIKGYWVYEMPFGGYHYLYCDGEKVHYLDFHEYSYGKEPKYYNRKANYEEVQSLFQQRDTSDYFFKIGHAIIVDNRDNLTSIMRIKQNDKDNIVTEERIFDLNTGAPSSQTYSLLATRSTEYGDMNYYLYFDEENKVLKLLLIQWDHGDWGWSNGFQKIEPTSFTGETKDKKKDKKEKNTKLKNKQSAWSSIFDENRVAAFNTGLSMNYWGNSCVVYLFLNAYSFSDDYSDGTASVSYISPNPRGGRNMELMMNCEYKYKDGVVYLKRGIFNHNNNWLPLRVHEMPLTVNDSYNKLSGRLWTDNLHDYSINAFLEHIDYTSVGVWTNGIF